MQMNMKSKIDMRIADGGPCRVVATTIRLPEDAWEQAKLMAFANKVPVNRIYTLALDDFFEKHARRRLATK